MEKAQSDNWIDFPVGKKGQLGKKILLNVLQVYDFLFTKLPTRISYKPY